MRESAVKWSGKNKFLSVKSQGISFQTKSGHPELSKEHHESKYAVITHTSDPWGGVKRSFCFLF